MAQYQEIEHLQLDIRGLSLHVAQIGKGDLGTVVFLHGFPEIWYTWRHQLVAVANAGFRAIAPDCRGYGLSGQPAELESASWEDLVADILAILDSLNIPKVFIVGKDFGAKPAYDFVNQHPDRVCGVVTLGVPYVPIGYNLSGLPEGFYVYRWKEPGRAEADFGRLDVKTVVRNIYILFSKSEIPIAAEGQEIMDLVDPSTPLPSWLSNEDLDVYAALYQKSGFKYPLQMPYRSFHKMKPLSNPKIEAPALLVMGEEDYVLKFPQMEDYIRTGMVKQFLPNQEVTFFPGGSHFIAEQFPDKINHMIITFLNNHI